MTAIFVGVRDGYLSAKMGGHEVFGPDGVPSYVGDGTPAQKTGEDLFSDFGHLVQPRAH